MLPGPQVQALMGQRLGSAARRRQGVWVQANRSAAFQTRPRCELHSGHAFCHYRGTPAWAVWALEYRRSSPALLNRHQPEDGCGGRVPAERSRTDRAGRASENEMLASRSPGGIVSPFWVQAGSGVVGRAGRGCRLRRVGLEKRAGARRLEEPCQQAGEAPEGRGGRPLTHGAGTGTPGR